MICLGQYKEAVTGRRFDNRVELDTVFEIYDLARGNLNYLLVYRWDRLGRDVGECFRAIKRFANIGVEINCPDKWIDFKDPNWPIMLGIEFGMAQSESNKISDRTKDGMYQANSQGYFTGKVPAGYTRVVLNETNQKGKRRKILVPNEKAHVVRTCIEQFVAGTATKQELYLKYKKDLEIGKSQFYVMFKNPLYAGLIYLKAYKENPAKIVTAKHEPIITVELLRKSELLHEQQTYSKRSQTVAQDSIYFAKGPIRCLITGSAMTAYYVQKKTGKTYHYYRSIAKGGQSLPLSKVNLYCTYAMKDLTLPTDLIAATKDVLLDRINAKNNRNKKRIKLLSDDQVKLSQRVSNLRDLLADKEISGAEYKQMSTDYSTRLKQVTAELAALKINLNKELEFRMQVLDLISNLHELYRYTNNQGKRKLLRAIFPDGFGIDVEAGKVLTTRINSELLLTSSKIATYEYIIEKPDLPWSASPVEGGKPEHFLTTNRLLISSLFTS